MKLNKNLDFNEFAVPTYDEWKDEAIKSLKGVPFEKKLFTQTFEEIVLKPIYYAFDIDSNYLKENNFPGFSPYLRGNIASGSKLKKWYVAQTISFYEPPKLNTAIKSNLKNGQNALNIHISRNEYYQFEKDSVACGTKLSNLNDIEVAFDGIDLEQYPVYFNSGDFYSEFADYFLYYLKTKNFQNEKIIGNLGADPFTELLVNGGSKFTIEQSFSNLSETFKKFKGYPTFGIVTINGSVYHNAGANAVQELACSFANSVEIINALIDKGHKPDEIIPKIRFHFAVSSDFFMQIAKIRAARLIWAKIVKEYGLDSSFQKICIHCSTSVINKTKYDPWVNILRSSIECLAAILGNADSIDVANFDFAYGYPGEFSQRISRNIQFVLQNEAHLLDTIDPVYGSYYLENITLEIASKVWSSFQNIQSQGGFLNSIKTGEIQENIAQSYEKQESSYLLRKQTLLGTNKYPLLNEKQPSDYEPFIVKSLPENELTHKSIEIPKLELKRFASKFESLRRNAEKYNEKYGSYPQVILLNFGELNEWKPRNDFSTDFLQVGGFQIVSSPVLTDKIEAFQYLLNQENKNIICICSSDNQYEKLIPELIPLIKKNYPLTFAILAGYPEDKVEEYKSYGINCFIHLKANVYETLHYIQNINNII